ncbi:cytochrome c oxidase polypeptide IV [Phakopsora pachyrhizi]|nr:cytochrome c oxidase polypeptide IV [Phakopsora pachyrhizi]
MSAFTIRNTLRVATRAIQPSGLVIRSRVFSSSRFVSAGDHHEEARPPIIQGPGAKPGTVPTDLEQATGIERFEILARMEGHNPFDRTPLQVTHMGTLDNPVKVPSLERTRIIGCTGFPADSHDTIYMKVSSSRPRRCPECGCAYVVDFQGDPDEPANHPPALSVIHEFPGEKPRLKWGWADMTTHAGGNQR